MNRDEILKNIYLLANSQGFYSGLYEKLSDGSKESEESLEYLEQQCFKDIVDMTLFFES